MPSDGIFARVGLLAAVSVVIGVSTLGTLLRPAPPDAAAPLLTLAPRHEPTPAAVTAQPQVPVPTAPAVGAGPASPVNPAPAATAAGSQASPPVGGPFVPATGSAAGEPAKGAPATAAAAPAAAAPRGAAASATTPDQVAPAGKQAAFPEIQPLDEAGIAGAAAAGAAGAAAASAAAPPPHAKPRKKVVDRAKTRRPRPAPFQIREFFAGRW